MNDPSPTTPIIGRIEPAPQRTPRHELIAMLIGAEPHLRQCTDSIGATYRLNLARRMREAIDAEKRALGVS